MEFRKKVGRRLRFWADRIDDEGAPRRLTSYTFTFEDGEGIRFREDGRGCRLWYLGNADYEKAHEESDSEQRRRERDEFIDRTLESLGVPGHRIREALDKIMRSGR
jgi:hypothetical protein